MRARPALAAALLAFCLSASVAVVHADTAAPWTGDPVVDSTVKLVDKNFWNPAALPAFHDAVRAVASDDKHRALDTDTATAEARILASLGASHTGRLTPDQLDYYELAGVFRYALHDNIRALFPPDGKVTYDGIGIASKDIDGKRFITDVYDGSPADRAGLKAGDEIVSADGQPFAEIGSFKGKAGHDVDLKIRHTAGADPVDVSVRVAAIDPQEEFVDAIRNSIHVVQSGGHEIGVIHLWSYTTGRITDVVNEALATKLKDVDGIVLDLRGRWGGVQADAVQSFVGGAIDMVAVDRDGDKHYVSSAFHKPVVAIVDEGTRSSMEILAYTLKKDGISLVGVPTAGDVLAATAYALPDGSLLELAVQNVLIDGKELEGHPITPDVSVPFDVRYANGADPQMDAALATLTDRLKPTTD
jgi:C-terminal processing protease CtpA/Prc